MTKTFETQIQNHSEWKAPSDNQVFYTFPLLYLSAYAVTTLFRLLADRETH